MPILPFGGAKVSRDDFLNSKITYGEMTDPRDGQVYKTFQIDSMVWMAQNLNLNFEEFGYNGKYASHCYDHNEKNCDVGGRFYPWILVYRPELESSSSQGFGHLAEKNTVQGICPDGWHIPGGDEWNVLLGLAEKSGRPFTSLKDEGTDNFGFSAILTGQMFIVEDTLMSRYAGTGAMFWMVTEKSNDKGSNCYYLSIDPIDGTYMISKSNWCDNEEYGSVRCVKNYPSSLDFIDKEDYELYGTGLERCDEVWLTEADYKTCNKDIASLYVYDKTERMPKICEYDKETGEWTWVNYD